MSETPFQIAVPASALDLLKRKLELTNLPDELEGAGSQYGVALEDIRRLVAYWKNGFDWRRVEAQLNAELPQFTRDITVDGHGTLNIHYIHKRSEVANAIPLLIIHGWPGSFFEFRKIIPLLSQSAPGNAPSFHVVAISLPGWGFSEGPKKQGFVFPQYAEVCNKLMISLGYDKYVVHGGDWGSAISETLASKYGQRNVMAWHNNGGLGPPPKFLTQPHLFLQLIMFPLLASKHEKERCARAMAGMKTGLAYFSLQSSAPQTVGYSLNDSPVGLLAWIYEKLVKWTDEYPWTDDEVLTWISLYWFSRAGPNASLRIYYEATKANDGEMWPKVPPTSTIPRGVSFFPKDIMAVPVVFLKSVSNLVFTSEQEGGGHFAAYEKPQELAKDLQRMFGRGGQAFGVVPGLDGYDKRRD